MRWHTASKITGHRPGAIGVNVLPDLMPWLRILELGLSLRAPPELASLALELLPTHLPFHGPDPDIILKLYHARFVRLTRYLRPIAPRHTANQVLRRTTAYANHHPLSWTMQ